MTEEERLAEIERLRTALEELCAPYQADAGTAAFDEVIKQMPETEQAMAMHLLSELEHLDAQGPG
jgi:hypothetical protein